MDVFIIIWDIIVVFVSVVIIAFIALGALVINVFIGIWNAGVWLVNILLQAWYWLVNNTAMAWAWLGIAVSNVLASIYNFFVDIANGIIKGLNKLGKGAVDTANGLQRSL